MKTLFFILTLLFLHPPVASGQGDDSSCCKMQLNGKATIDNLSNEYQRLKKDQTHCCEKWGSGLMKTMEILKDSIKVGVSEKRIIAIMGQPDETADKNHPIEHHFTRLEGETVIIYYWRERHDFLYFIIKDGVLIRKDWFYAWE